MPRASPIAVFRPSEDTSEEAPAASEGVARVVVLLCECYEVLGVFGSQRCGGICVQNHVFYSRVCGRMHEAQPRAGGCGGVVLGPPALYKAGGWLATK